MSVGYREEGWASVGLAVVLAAFQLDLAPSLFSMTAGPAGAQSTVGAWMSVAYVAWFWFFGFLIVGSSKGRSWKWSLAVACAGPVGLVILARAAERERVDSRR